LRTVLGAVSSALLGSGAHAGGLHFLAWLGALGLLVLVTLIQALRRPRQAVGGATRLTCRHPVTHEQSFDLEVILA
jgi:hypothetical protein